mmetsp:Transcript_32446/g.71234  ORF Transcript_32446/g.71234 Transcript_32446/m.71234 type:complete len:629 (-) Transcript_32446:162-2048(-)
MKISLAFLAAFAAHDGGRNGRAGISTSSPGRTGRPSSGSIFAAAAPPEDRIASLPLFGPPPTPQYSGYLDGTPGCDTETNGNFCMIHYWFATAEGDEPEKKPVVLWLNGGPGSPSTLGFLQELGPLLLNATGGLMANPYSWTKLANVFVIESPVGVGYSYCSAQVDGKVCTNTDKYTASTARAAVADFFRTKFPELASNEFFITGESYAGVYIPTLTKEILDNAPDINLVGIAVGDPCTDNKAQSDSMDSVWYSHKYGLGVSDAEYDLLWDSCKLRQPNLIAQGGKYVARERVREYVQDKHGLDLRLLSRGGTADWDEDEVQSIIRKAIREVLYSPGSDFVNSGQCKIAYRKFLMSTSHALSQGWKDMYINDYSLYGPVVASEDRDMATYMMRDDVREALHVASTSIVPTWPHPPQGFDYTSEYDACNWGEVPEGTPSMIDFYREIAPKLKYTVVYNGDTDPCVSYEGTQVAIERVGFKQVKGGGFRPWFYNHTAANIAIITEKAAPFGPDLLTVPTGAQFGGEVVNYQHNLNFLTVHGSGHMVPQFRPQAALHMLEKILNKELFSPYMPSNHTLAKMSDGEFEDAINSWTEAAKGSPYITSGMKKNTKQDKSDASPSVSDEEVVQTE